MTEVLVDRNRIAERTAETGREIGDFYRGKDFVMVIIANGGIFFGADLARSIKLDFPVDIIAVESYRNDVQDGELIFRCPPKLDLAGKHVLLVDEVLDSGVTLARTAEDMKKRGAVDVRYAVLVTKERPRRDDAVKSADWSCFSLPDVYLVGCGLDSNELYRNLPYLGVVKN